MSSASEQETQTGNSIENLGTWLVFELGTFSLIRLEKLLKYHTIGMFLMKWKVFFFFFQIPIPRNH